MSGSHRQHSPAHYHHSSTSSPYHRSAREHPSTSSPYHRSAREHPSTSSPYHRSAREHPSTSSPYHRSAREHPSTSSPYHRSAPEHPSTSSPYHRSFSQQRTTAKADRNFQLQQKYRPFHVPPDMFEIKYVNKYTTSDKIHTIINHVKQCNQFTIDTEGEKATNNVVIIQVQSLPRVLPMFVILFELEHMPSNDSSSKVTIKQLFELIFRSTNTIYSWGSMDYELSLIKINDLFKYPIEATQRNIQLLFPSWYNWALSRCGTSDLSDDQHVDTVVATRMNNSLSSCTCHEASPYRLTEKWSLQLALAYVAHVFIDKSITVNHWSTSIDPKHSPLSSSTREKWANYLIYDCLATTYLVKPVMEYWTFEKLEKTNLVELFLALPTSSCIPSSTPAPFRSSTTPFTSSIINNSNTRNGKKVKNIDGQLFRKVLNDDLEDISDEDGNEEIYLHQLVEPLDAEHKLGSVDEPRLDPENIPDGPRETITLAAADDTNQQVESDGVLVIQDVQDIIDDQQIESNEPAESQRKSAYQRRSRPAKIRHNRKHARQQKKHRFDHPIRRKSYYRFKAFMIRKILRLYQIPFVHMKKDNDDVVVGLRNEDTQRQAEHDLATNIFNRRSFYYYKNKYRW